MFSHKSTLTFLRMTVPIQISKQNFKKICLILSKWGSYNFLLASALFSLSLTERRAKWQMSLSVSDTAGICIEILFCTVLWMLGTEEKQPFVIALNTQSFNCHNSIISLKVKICPISYSLSNRKSSVQEGPQLEYRQILTWALSVNLLGIFYTNCFPLIVKVKQWICPFLIESSSKLERKWPLEAICFNLLFKAGLTSKFFRGFFNQVLKILRGTCNALSHSEFSWLQLFLST